MRGRGGFVPSGGAAGPTVARILTGPPALPVAATLVVDASVHPAAGQTFVLDVGAGPVTWTCVTNVVNNYDVVRGLNADDFWGFLRDAITQEDAPGSGSNQAGFQYRAPIKQLGWPASATHDTGANTLTLTALPGAAGNANTVHGTATTWGSTPEPFAGGVDGDVAEEGEILYFGGSFFVYAEGSWSVFPGTPYP